MKIANSARKGIGLAAALALLAPAAWAQVPPAAVKAAQAVDGKAIAGVTVDQAAQAGNWLTHGRTYGEQRFSPLDQVDTQTVKKLGLAWSLPLGTNRGVEATPLVVDGILYASLPWSDVIAVDVRTGKELWRFDAEVPKEWGRNACCDVVNRGVAMWKGRVYVGTIDGRLVALDAATGKKVWDINTIDRTRPYTITGAPRIVKGKVVIGNGGAELGVRGYISAYDADTGKMAWRFFTVPGDPSKPFENKAMEAAAKTWRGTWWEQGGGGTAWDSMAYDPALDTLYVGTGNGSPWSAERRSPGGGDNLYLSSILALDPDTGDLKWHYQTTPGDSWDYTATQHMILADLEIEGKKRQVIMQAPKNGFFYVLDRKTGELLSAKPFAKITWASHVDMKTGRPVETPEARWGDKPQLVFPSPSGAHNWHPMSYSPKTGLVYIPAMEFPALFVPMNGFKYQKGGWNTGSDFRGQTDVPPEMLTGTLLAWDPVKGEKRWQVPMGTYWNGGTLATGGDLVFQGNGKGMFAAYNAATGELLWQSPAGTGVVAAPITYMVDGEQYVSVMAGWGGVGALAYGRAAKAAGQFSEGRLLTYKIGGTAPAPAVATAAVPPSPPPALLKVSTETLKLGEETFAAVCAVCHGIGAVGGGVVPDLRHASPETHARWSEIVMKGERKANGMAAFNDLITQEQSDAIRAYVIYRAHEGDEAKPIEVKAPTKP